MSSPTETFYRQRFHLDSRQYLTRYNDFTGPPTFDGKQYFVIQRRLGGSPVPTVGHTTVESAKAEASNLHSQLSLNSRRADNFTIRYIDEVNGVSRDIFRTTWGITGIEFTPLLTQTSQLEKVTNTMILNFSSLINMTPLPEEIFIVVQAGEQITGVIYTEESEALVEASKRFQKSFGEKAVYVFKTHKIALPKPPQVDFSEPRPTPKQDVPAISSS